MFPFRKNPYRDQDIIEGIREGGMALERALKTLYQSHLGYIRTGCRKFGLSDSEATDAYNDALIGLMQQIKKGGYSGKARLSSYLFQIFRFKCVDQFKKKQTNQEKFWEDALPQLADRSRDFLQILIGKESWDYVLGLLDKLGENCKKMLILAAQGYKPDEIAQEMDLKNAQTAKSRKYKCAQRFRELINNKSTFKQ